MDVLSPEYLGVQCPVCGDTDEASLEPASCPNCGGLMEPQVDLLGLSLSRGELTDRPFDSMWRYAELFPLAPEAAVTMGEGCTPLVPCPHLANEFGVGMVYLKLESDNPTGTFKDRGQSLAMTAARGSGADTISLASAGNAGQSAAAYAGRAGLEAKVFLPSRAGFTQKAMVNVHGGDLTVVEGQLSDAGAAHAEALAEHEEWYSVATSDMPFRREGKKTMYYETVEQLGWNAPDHIVYPTGGGVGLLGMAKAVEELERLEWLSDEPSFYAAQSSGCQPVVDAFESGAETVGEGNQADTICGGIAVSAPSAGRRLLQVLRESDGDAVATSDDAILDAALDVAREEGLEIAPTSAAAVSGARKLADNDTFGANDDVVIVATGSGLKDADVLRSHLMSKGE